METLIHRWVTDCRAGTNPRTVARVHSGWVVLGTAQFVRGYSLLIPDPVVPDLNALERTARRQLLDEVTVVGDALLAVTDALRINYEILGNLEPALHVHVCPRYADEPDDLRTRPIWFYDWDAARQFDAQTDAALMQAMRRALEDAGVVTG